YTTFPGTTPKDLRAAFSAHTTGAHGRFWTFNEHREIAGTSLYKAWVLVPARKARQIAQRAGVGAVREPPSPDHCGIAMREASGAAKEDVSYGVGGTQGEGGSRTAPTQRGD
ncbi:MAG: hypothetical protein M3Z19_07155, partial [Chloroflexota bacterium]|nr:hypothetical protein [Chloroflexota bacterium]